MNANAAHKKAQGFTKRAEGRYDLPLNKSGNSRFIILLITMMTFLAVLALSASFALSGVAAKWSSGLENKLTVEIPANAGDDGDVSALKIEVKKILDNIDNVSNIDVMSDDAIAALVAPWLGEGFSIAEVPMPSLIAVETKENTPAFFESLQEELAAVHPDIVVDAHEEWLDDFLRMIGALKFGAVFVSLIIAATAVVAITGIIRARMAEHRPDLELLHLMGASDGYIAGQFQRYALRLGLLGGAFGLFAGAIGLAVFSAGINGGDSDLFPSLRLSGFAIFTLFCLPFMACALCSSTAKITVLRSLARMP